MRAWKRIEESLDADPHSALGESSPMQCCPGAIGRGQAVESPPMQCCVQSGLMLQLSLVD